MSSTILKSACIVDNSKYGGEPVKSSMTVQPRDQMSLATPPPSISMISGATMRTGENNDNIKKDGILGK